MKKSNREAENIIQNAKDILIVISRPIDYDCLAGGIVLKHQFEQKGKKVEVVACKKIPKKLEWLPFLDEVMVKDTRQINFFNCDLVIALDGGNTKQFALVASDEEFDFGGFRNVLNVDHHLGNTHFAAYEIWDPEKSSTVEILLESLIDIEKIDSKEATLLYSGLVYDTGNFKYHITEQTLSFAAKLLQKGADFETIVNKYFFSNKKEEFEVFAWLIKESKQDKNLNLNYVTVDERKLKKKLGISRKSIQGGFRLFKNYFARAIEGVTLGAVFKDYDKKVAIIIRGKSNENKVPIPKINEELGGEGGGHFNSGAMMVEGKLDEVVTKFKLTLNKLKEKYEKS